MLWCEGDDCLESFADTRDPPTHAWPILSLPDMPAVSHSTTQVGFFELDRDAHRQWVVPQRVKADEQPELEVDAEDDRGVDTSEVVAERMVVLHPGSLAAVADLNSVLVGWSPLDRSWVAAKRVAEDAEPLVVLPLNAQVYGGPVAAADIKEFGARLTNGVLEEDVKIVSTDHAIDVRV
jgi:hypothetical protein